MINNDRRSGQETTICFKADHVCLAILDGLFHAGDDKGRTDLGDSANRRLSIAQGFLAVDAILSIYINITENLVVYPEVINKHINQELPFMATEYILMEAVKRGGDRQELHEKIREYSMEAARLVKTKGKDNCLLDLIKKDESFNFTPEELDSIMNAKNFIGRASEQTSEFIEQDVIPILRKYEDYSDISTRLTV